MNPSCAAKILRLRPEVQPLATKHFEKVCLLLAAYCPGISATISETYRSPEAQAKAFATGRSKAKPGQSAHEYGMAWDICLLKDGKLLPDNDLAWHLIPFAAGLVGQGLLTCGADFRSLRDMPHTEISKWRDLRKQHQ